MKFTKLFIGLWFIAVTVIIYTSLQPQFSPPEKYHIDKFLHLGGYLFLSLLSAISFKKERSVSYAVVILILVAILTEIGQLYVPHRMGTIGDAATNIIGITLGYWLGKLLRQKFGNFLF